MRAFAVATGCLVVASELLATVTLVLDWLPRWLLPYSFVLLRCDLLFGACSVSSLLSSVCEKKNKRGVCWCVWRWMEKLLNRVVFILT